MILRDIFIELDRLQFPTAVAYAFKLRSRCLCNFIGRYVWEKQINVPGFNRIVVTLSKDGRLACSVNSCQVACITLPLTDDVSHGELSHEFYIACLTRGLDQIIGEFPEVVATVHEGIAAFREAGFKNEWIEKKRRFRDLGVSAALRCVITQERFVLRLIVQRAAKVAYDQEIFASDPDEITFAHHFKDVMVDEGQIVVVGRNGKPLFALSLDEIEGNKSA